MFLCNNFILHTCFFIQSFLEVLSILLHALLIVRVFFKLFTLHFNALKAKKLVILHKILKTEQLVDGIRKFKLPFFLPSDQSDSILSN